MMKSFSSRPPKALPVIILADVSGSMAAEGKIEALNRAMSEMIASFAAGEELRARIQVCVITFGGVARVHVPLAHAQGLTWSDAAADGSTPLGAALTLAADLVEDQVAIPSSAYRPTIIVISDGQPTDPYRDALARLTKPGGRAQKADRMALAIGADADETVLRELVGSADKRLFRAEDARSIRDFFRFATMTVAARSRDPNPNIVPVITDPFGADGF